VTCFVVAAVDGDDGEGPFFLAAVFLILSSLVISYFMCRYDLFMKVCLVVRIAARCKPAHVTVTVANTLVPNVIGTHECRKRLKNSPTQRIVSH